MSKKISKTSKIILVVVLCLVVLGGVAGVVAWTQSDKYDTKDLSYIGMYEVGGLDSAGNYMSTNASIYTKKPIECQGLNCYLDFDSTISYQLYFYDQNNEFVHTTGRLTGTFVEEAMPFFAKYVRIVITPNDDDKVTSLEIVKYAKQLNISVNREQGFKNYTENLFDFCYQDKYLKEGVLTDNDESVTKYKQVVTCEFVDISAYKDCLYFKDAPNSSWAGGCLLACYDSEKNYVGSIKPNDVASVSFVSSLGLKYWNISRSAFADDVKYIRMYWQNPAPFPELHCR